MTETVPSLHDEIIGPIGPGNPRNGEGDIVALRDGRLLLGWSRFTGGGADHSAADIYGRFSADGGHTWGPPFVLQENIGTCNVMCVGFVRLRSGDLLFGFLIKNDEEKDCRYFIRRSRDEGQTWTSPVMATPETGFFVTNNSLPLQTRAGRLVVPVAKSIGDEGHRTSGASCFFSDDEGSTWRRQAAYLELPGPVGMQEPGVVECADGSLWMWARTDKGCVYGSRSWDGGASWSAPEPTPLVAPVSPATAKRLPNSDDILIVYNDRRGVPFSTDRRSPFNWRTPLASAVSSDGGRTWHHHKIIEPDLTKSYCYTSITFHNDTTLLTYYVGKAGGPNLLDMRLKIVPTSAWTA